MSFMYDQLPMYQQQGIKALKYDLTNITALLGELGNPQDTFKSIHIAGTNGKGTTAHLLAAAFQANGYKTGLYTSPHYKDFRERIKIDSRWIETDYLIRFFQAHFRLIGDLRPSYFEWSVALAFSYFADRKVDMAIIEVGLGGRLDSTNVIRPMLSVITNISFDHMQTLGNTLAAIAGEKAGIIKANTPVVIGAHHPETAPVFEGIAAERQAPLYYADGISDFPVLNTENDGPQGPFREQNIRCALTTVRVFNRHYPDQALDENLVVEGMQNMRSLTRYIGRWEQLGTDPLIIADGAHNADSWQKNLSWIKKKDFRQVHLVIGFVADKAYEDILQLLPGNASYYFCMADIPRALNPNLLQEAALKHGLAGKVYGSVTAALEAAKSRAGRGDLILVSGSIFVVGEILPD